MQSRYLSALLLIVVAEYVCYALGELIFLETLKANTLPPQNTANTWAPSLFGWDFNRI